MAIKVELHPPESPEKALERAREAQSRIGRVVRKTEMPSSKSASDKAGSKILLKLENQQIAGSFKIRGAANKIFSLSEAEKKSGIIASSAGNHSQGVAYSAHACGVNAKIVMPLSAPLVKVLATRNYGAQVIQHGEIYDEAFDKAQEVAEEEKRIFIHPYQDDHVIAGQATVALEIFEQQPNIDTLVVPVGGGGLISGVAMVAKAMNPKCRVIGVQAKNISAMSNLFNADATIEAFKPTIADGIAVKRPSREMFDKYISKYVDEMLTVTEEEIAESIVFLLERKKTVAEGAGASGLAAAFSGRVKLGERTAVIVSGGNIDINTVSKVIQRGLTQSGRLTTISVLVDDSPGSLGRVADIIGEQRANILEVEHSRTMRGLGLRQTRINFLLETIDDEHIERVCKALEALGGRVIS